MGKAGRFTCICTFAAFALSNPRPASAQVLSQFYLGATFNYSYGMGVSANGRVASGYAVTATGPNVFHGMRWRRESGMQDLGTYAGQAQHDSTYATSVSGDGATIAGYGLGSESGQPATAFTWDDNSGFQLLGFMGGGTRSQATGISGDGSVVVGTGNSSFGTSRSFRWTNALGMLDIGNLSGGSSVAATGVSSDGNVIVGNADSSAGANRAFRWTNSGMVDLGALPGATQAFAYGVNADGSVIVGSSGTSSSDQHPFRWTNGSMEDLGLFPGSTSTTASAVSPEGDVIVGNYAIPAIPHQLAFIWRQGSGYQDLNLMPFLWASLNSITARSVPGWCRRMRSAPAE